ncbi:MAG: ABC transporter substrate-binding protein [Mycetocola sp.]
MMHRPRTSAAQRTLALLAAGTLALGLAACSSAAPTAEDDSPTAGTVDWWGWTPELGVGERYIELFNKEYPDITVNYRQIAVADYDSVLRPGLSSSDGPDVFNLAPGGGVGGVERYAAYATDLTDAMAGALGDDWKTAIQENGVIGMTTESGQFAGVPVGSTYSGSLWVNPQILDDNGVEVPTTYDEWKQACDTLSAAGETCIGLGAGANGTNQDLVHAIANSLEPGVWTDAVAGEVPWDHPTLVEAMTIFADMVDSNMVQAGALGMQQYPDVNNLFMSGDAAMVTMGSWYMQYSTVPSMEAAVAAAGSSDADLFPMVNVPFPDMGNGSGNETLFGDVDYGLGVSTGASHPQAAQTFATWLGTSEAAQQEVANALNNIPSLSGVTPDWDAIELVDADTQQESLTTLQERASAIVEPRLGDINAELGQLIGDALGAVATGSATPAEALATLEASAE